MTIETNHFISDILDNLSCFDYIKPEDLPNIDLYMDQVTTFMDQQLSDTKRYKEDKILTKTMINNYAKNDLLPPPVKKKYSKEHVLMLTFIYYFKNILSINDIQRLLTPLAGKYFGSTEEFNLENIYREVLQLEKSETEHLKNDIFEKYRISCNAFELQENDAKEALQLFSFICLLFFDVYAKKQLIEKLIDRIPPKTSEEEKPKKKEKEPLKE